MEQQSHNDTHSRLKALESQNTRLERALETLTEAMHETSRQLAELLVYQKQHDKNNERMGSRVEELEKAIQEKKIKIERLRLFVASVLAVGGFSIGYIVDWVSSLNKELHEFDKRIERIEYEHKNGIRASYSDSDICPPQEPVPIPTPETISTLKPILPDGI